MIVLQGLFVFITGLSIGWLSGLSVTPVISAVLASLLGIAGGVAGGLKLFRAKSPSPPEKTSDAKQGVDAIPIGLLALGIAVGSPLGMMARTHHLFEPEPAVQSASTEQKETDTRCDEKKSKQDMGVLFLTRKQLKDCERLLSMVDYENEEAFVDTMRSVDFKWANRAADEIQDVKTLKIIVRCICETQ